VADVDGEKTPEKALEQVWRGLCDGYPLREYVGAWGDAWLEEFRPRVRAASDLAEAFPIIEELVLRFQDCHTRLHWPGKPERIRPPARLGWVEGGVAVLCAEPGTGLRPGERVLAVDGLDAEAAVRAAWPHVSGAHPEGHVQGACDHMVAGAPGTSLSLTTERSTGVLERRRTSQTAAAVQPAVALRQLPGDDAAVLRVRAWHGERLAEHLDRALGVCCKTGL
jgi:hypothetical protein